MNTTSVVRRVILRYCIAANTLFNALIGIEMQDRDKNTLLKADYDNANSDFFAMHVVELAYNERILGFRSASKGN